MFFLEVVGFTPNAQMKYSFTLTSKAIDDVILRTITDLDCENLRQWKNANRFVFFFQEVITPERQEEWFKGYLEREDDYMFIVIHRNQAIGCLGFRLFDRKADIYNVILSHPEMGRKGLMSKAIQLMCSYIYSNFTRDIGLKVLRSNPAVDWYRKNGFHEVAVHETFLELKLDTAQFQPCEFQRLIYRAPNSV